MSIAQEYSCGFGDMCVFSLMTTPIPTPWQCYQCSALLHTQCIIAYRGGDHETIISEPVCKACDTQTLSLTQTSRYLSKSPSFEDLRMAESPSVTHLSSRMEQVVVQEDEDEEEDDDDEILETSIVQATPDIQRSLDFFASSSSTKKPPQPTPTTTTTALVPAVTITPRQPTGPTMLTFSSPSDSDGASHGMSKPVARGLPPRHPPKASSSSSSAPASVPAAAAAAATAGVPEYTRAYREDLMRHIQAVSQCGNAEEKAAMQRKYNMILTPDRPCRGDDIVLDPVNQQLWLLEPNQKPATEVRPLDFSATSRQPLGELSDNHPTQKRASRRKHSRRRTSSYEVEMSSYHIKDNGTMPTDEDDDDSSDDDDDDDDIKVVDVNKRVVKKKRSMSVSIPRHSPSNNNNNNHHRHHASPAPATAATSDLIMMSQPLIPSSSPSRSSSSSTSSTSSSSSSRTEPQPVMPASAYDGPACVLPITNPGKYEMPRINGETMAELLNGGFKDCLDGFMVFDCRYDYEYYGGHIEGAFHTKTQSFLSKFYKANAGIQKNIAIIFHCEYSANRGPKQCQFFREMDRKANTYPSLSFPQLYILDGGYRRFFFDGHISLCQPQNYVSMWDPSFTVALKQEAAIARGGKREQFRHKNKKSVRRIQRSNSVVCAGDLSNISENME